MRDLDRLVKFVIQEVLPPTEVALANDLKQIMQRAAYVPPESQAGVWRMVGDTMYRHAGLPEGEDWKIRMGNIFNDKEKIPEEWKPK